MPIKAQAEFALILGLLIIAIVVGIYMYSSTPTPLLQPRTEEQKAVASYVGDLIRDAATSTMSEMYLNGGYLSGTAPPMGSVSHKALGSSIAMWQTCGNYDIPDVQREFARGVEDYIRTNMPDSQAIGGRAVTFGKQSLAVSTSMYDNKVSLSVNLPTVIEGQAMPQPYVVDVATKMGRIYDFSKNFAQMQANLRVLDNHLLSSLTHSSEHSRPCWVPSIGVAKRSHTFTWGNLRDCMEMHIKYSLSNTRLGEEYPVDEDGKRHVWGMEFFPVPAVIDYSDTTGGETGSKKYDDLNVNFYFGDDNGLDRSEFAAPEHLRIEPKVGPFMRFTQGVSTAEYGQTYSVKYPVIVNVWDSSMRKSFKFGLLVYVDNSAIGYCTAAPGLPAAIESEYSQSYDDTCVDGATEDANILVRYDDGSDVAGARVSFAGCDLGTTGMGAPIIAKVPAAWGGLTVRAGQNRFTECYSYSQLKNIIMTIPRSKHYVFKFHTVGISKSGTTYTVDSVTDSTKRTEVGMQRTGDSCEPPDPEIIINMDDDGLFVSEIDVDYLPVTGHTVSVETYDGQTVGGFVSMTAFTPSGTELHVYAPDLAGFSESEIDAVRSLYTSCGMEPISAVEYSGKVGCSWTG